MLRYLLQYAWGAQFQAPIHGATVDLFLFDGTTQALEPWIVPHVVPVVVAVTSPYLISTLPNREEESWPLVGASSVVSLL
jgi:hypothetical protein